MTKVDVLVGRWGSSDCWLVDMLVVMLAVVLVVQMDVMDYW